jgi:hypothetical protein
VLGFRVNTGRSPAIAVNWLGLPRGLPWFCALVLLFATITRRRLFRTCFRRLVGFDDRQCGLGTTLTSLLRSASRSIPIRNTPSLTILGTSPPTRAGARRLPLEFLALHARPRRMRQWVRCSTRMSTEIVDNSNIIFRIRRVPLQRCKSMTDSG